MLIRPPSGLFLIALLVWLLRTYQPNMQEKTERYGALRQPAGEVDLPREHALAFFLGMCSFLAMLEEGRHRDRPGRGGGVRAGAHRALNQIILKQLLAEGALHWCIRRSPGST